MKRGDSLPKLPPRFPPLPLLSHFQIWPPLDVVEPAGGAPVVWCPFSFPPKGYTVYWNCVHGVAFWASQKVSDYSLAEMDAFIPLIAYMTSEEKYSDEQLAGIVPRLGPLDSLAHTIKTMPDVTPVLIVMNMWAKKEKFDGPYKNWASLLIKATPLPCKSRNLENAFSEAVEDPEFFGFIIRVLLGSFLGVYGGETAPFACRLWCYAAFVVFQPSVKELKKFIIENKSTVSLCVENFILFSMWLTPLHAYLEKNYQWNGVISGRVAALAALQRHVHSIAVDENFLTNAENWTSVENMLATQTIHFKKLCFRSVVEPFRKTVIEQGFKIWRRDSGEKCYTSSLSIPQQFLEYIWSIPCEVSNQRHLDAHVELLPSRFFDDKTRAFFRQMQVDYYMERKTTAAQHLVAGTAKKKTGLYYQDKQAFFDVLAYCMAANHRMKMRWALLPRSWALAQAHALAKGRDTLHPDAGCYFLCPNCSKVRTEPVKFPKGQKFSKREKGRYASGVRFDLGESKAYCKDFSPKRKKNIMKKRQKKKNKNTDQFGDNIRVCYLTPLVQICMVGVLLWTEKDGNLVLCVDCGTMIKWTRECISPRGPTCGCSLSPAANPKEPIGECEVCENDLFPRSHFRTHDVLDVDSGEITKLHLCWSHRSHWVTKLMYILPKHIVVEAVRQKKWAAMINGTPLFFDPPPPKKNKKQYKKM